MTLRKTPLLAGLTLAALAFAIPSVASAETPAWLKNHEPFTEGQHETVNFVGWAKFEDATDTDSYECEVRGTVTLEFEHTGKNTAFVAEPTSSCVGKGLFEKCKLEKHELVGRPVVHATSDTTILVTNVHLYNKYVDDECFIDHTTLTFPAITLTPHNLGAPTTITAVHISGTGEAHTKHDLSSTTSLTHHIIATGTLEAETAVDKRFGIGRTNT